MMAKLCPAAMLFVTCKVGISHNPAEYASPYDMASRSQAADPFLSRTLPASQ